MNQKGGGGGKKVGSTGEKGENPLQGKNDNIVGSVGDFREKNPLEGPISLAVRGRKYGK